MHLPTLRQGLSAVFDLFSHYACLGCAARTHDPSPLCASCLTCLEPAPSPPDDVRVAWAFDGPLVRAVHRAKFGGDPTVARRLGALLLPACEDLDGAVELVVSVPLGAKRLFLRGYNQSTELARAAAKTLGAPIAYDAIERIRETPTQTALDRAARRRNVENAFSARERRVGGRAVLLIDDVVTTGATLEACREALMRAGARSVTCAALAHATLRASLPADR